MARVSFSRLDHASANASSSNSSPSSSPEKENRRRNTNKRNTGHTSAALSSKRRCLTDRSSNMPSQMPSSQRNNGRKFYDPDQNPQERRGVLGKFRSLTTKFNTSRDTYLQSGSNGILETIRKADELYVDVKQTSDATIDSRLLANAADLSHKKAAQLTLGDVNAGIDVDEFVSKCIGYMRRGPDLSTNSRNAAPRATQRDPDDSDDPDEGDAMNWEWLGRAACLQCNARPVVSSWLLGPLSVQKRTRQLTQRRENERFDATQVIRPQELRQEDLAEQQDVSLTETCNAIYKLLAKTIFENIGKVEDILSVEDSEEVTHEVMDKHDICDDGGVPLYKFCINSRSFGQSVENLFYVSFLVRDGLVGVSTDSRGIPTLHKVDERPPHEAQAMGMEKAQNIFSLDFESWQELIEAFGIDEPMIPHREERAEDTGTTWYAGG
ncbi:uncharacterized protein N7483_000725 [Penicillium malachiteum]|uniref:uncharacterized protein n=1 Tax=Penicillium malachiteum TaxID=1324776 RepID=UPI0025480BBC|nr:uncharacterized protein N7483_000725 [Penicillium malachiteum]KAJ5735600.1 hypothetical protein N7483_000725 [Penicillium malachiteum]